MAAGIQYSDLDMERAIAAYVVHGTFAEAERLTGVSQDAIRKRKARHPEWFAETVERIRLDHEDEFRAVVRKAVMSGISQTLDRLENGDLVADNNGAYTKRKPMLGRDAAWIAAVMTDKLRISLGLATSISAKSGDSTGAKLDALRKAATEAAREQAKDDGKLVEMGRSGSESVRAEISEPGTIAA